VLSVALVSASSWHEERKTFLLLTLWMQLLLASGDWDWDYDPSTPNPGPLCSWIHASDILLRWS